MWLKFSLNEQSVPLGCRLWKSQISHLIIINKHIALIAERLFEPHVNGTDPTQNIYVKQLCHHGDKNQTEVNKFHPKSCSIFFSTWFDIFALVQKVELSSCHLRELQRFFIKLAEMKKCGTCDSSFIPHYTSVLQSMNNSLQGTLNTEVFESIFCGHYWRKKIQNFIRNCSWVIPETKLSFLGN